MSHSSVNEFTNVEKLKWVSTQYDNLMCEYGAVLAHHSMAEKESSRKSLARRMIILYRELELIRAIEDDYAYPNAGG